MKLQFGFGFSNAHVVMILLTMDLEDRKILGIYHLIKITI